MGKLICFLALFFASFFVYALNDCNDPFILELENENDYFRAMSFLKQIEYKARGKRVGFICSKKIMKLYYKHEEYDHLHDWIRKTFKNYPKFAENYGSLKEMEAGLAFIVGNYGWAIRETEKSKIKQDILINTFSKSIIKEPENASCEFKECKTLQDINLNFSDKNKKSTSLALLLGIVPGGGQIYAERYAAGTVSFILNSVLIGITYYAFKNDEEALGILSGLTSLSFYTGSIYAGYEATRRYNLVIDKQRIEKIRSINLKIKLLDILF